MRPLGISFVHDVEPGLGNGQRMEMIKAAGFDYVFLREDENCPLLKTAREAQAAGLKVESSHAPYQGINALWADSPEAAVYLDGLRQRIDGCQEAAIPLMVMHVSYGNHPPPVSDAGLDQLLSLCDYARRHQVHLAFENLESTPHLEAALKASDPYHGLCWDCGHNHAYTPEVDILKRHGGRLQCIHVHDNLGQRIPGQINSEDDLHLIPFAGSIDWPAFARNLKNSGYQGPLTLELRNKKTSPCFAHSLPAFLAEAYASALRLRAMCDGLNAL